MFSFYRAVFKRLRLKGCRKLIKHLSTSGSYCEKFEAKQSFCLFVNSDAVYIYSVN